jgi:hypothetical protein
MIQHLQQKSLELRWRMERVCSKILSGQQQQQQSSAAHVSTAAGDAQLPDLSLERSQELADRLLVMLDQQQQQQQQGQPAAPDNAQQDAAAAAQHAPASAGSSASAHAAFSSQSDAVAVAAAVAAAIAAERSGQLSAEGSKAWQQKLREQLLGSSSVEPGDGGLKQHLQQQQQVAVTATAAGVVEQAIAEEEGLSRKAKVSFLARGLRADCMLQIWPAEVHHSHVRNNETPFASVLCSQIRSSCSASLQRLRHTATQADATPMQANMCCTTQSLIPQAPLHGLSVQQQQQLPPISDLLPRSQRNTTSSGGYVISTAPDEVIDGFCDSLRFSEALNPDVNDTLTSQGDNRQQQQQMRHRALRSSAGYAPTWGYASESSSDDGEQQAPSGQQHTAAYSDSSNDSSPLVSRDDAAPAVRSSHLQQLSFLGAFDHLETAAQEAAAAEGDAQAEPDREFSLSLQQQLLRRSSAGGIGRGEPVRASFSALAGNNTAILAESAQQQQQQQQQQEQPELEESPAPAAAAARRTAAGDHVVTWYSAVGGSIDFGSPEPPSPQGEESFKTTAMLRVAGRSAAARMAAAAHQDAAAAVGEGEGAALPYDSDEDEDEADEQAGPAEAAAAVSLAAEVSAAASSSSSSRQRRRWDRSAQQQQQQLEPGALFEVQQQQQQQRHVEDEGVRPRWSTRPSWAAAGLGGYRWVLRHQCTTQGLLNC